MFTAPDGDAGVRGLPAHRGPGGPRPVTQQPFGGLLSVIFISLPLPPCRQLHRGRRLLRDGHGLRTLTHQLQLRQHVLSHRTQLPRKHSITTENKQHPVPHEKPHASNMLVNHLHQNFWPKCLTCLRAGWIQIHSCLSEASGTRGLHRKSAGPREP